MSSVQPSFVGFSSTTSASVKDLLPIIAQLEPLADLPVQYHRNIAGAARLTRRYAGEIVLARYSKANYVLYLIQGAVVSRRGGGPPKTIDASVSPHRNAIYDVDADIEINAVKDSLILEIPKEVYAQQLGLAAQPGASTNPEVNYLENWQQLDGLERALSFGVLAHLPMSNVHNVVSRMEEIDVAAGAVIFEQGATADYYYIIKAGTVEVTRVGRDGNLTRLAVKVAGDAFGDDALITNSPRNATLRMLSAGKLLRVLPEDFKAFIQTPLCTGTQWKSAQTLLDSGACLLDLRDAELAARLPVPGATHIPMFLLRNKIKNLESNRNYITYGNSPAESELGCYLLAERGLTAQYISDVIPDTGITASIPIHLSTVELTLETIEAASAPGRKRLPEVPTMMLKGLIEAERRRFEGLLAMRAVEIRESAERSLERRVALRERELRAQHQASMAQLKMDHQALLNEARKLQNISRELETERVALEAQKRAFEEERVALRQQLGAMVADDINHAL